MKKNNLDPKRVFLRTFYQKNKLNLSAAILLAAAGGTFMPVVSWLLGAVVDAMSMADMGYLRRLAVIMAMVTPAAGLLCWLSDRANARFLNRAVHQYKALAFQKISGKGISAFAGENTGRYLSALTNDVTAIEQQYLEKLLSMVDCCVSFALGLGLMLWSSPALTAVVLAGAALPLLVSVFLSPKAAALETEVSDANEGFMARTKDLLSGFSVLKSFKAEKEAQRLFLTSDADLEQTKRRKRNFAAVMTAAGDTAGLLMQLGMFLVGAVMAIRGSITPGTVLTFVNLVNVILRPINLFPTFLAGRKAAFALVEKLAQITEENAAHSGEKIPAKLEDAIAFDRVTFGYEEGKPVLKEVSVRFEAGKKYAIVGGSGSGKTTLLNLLMGAYPLYSGSLTIDGRELSAIDPDSLYDVMSLIGQNVFLFDDTIRRNITMFREFPDGEVDSAAARSGLLPVIAAKGEGYRCGENGVGLSGGERQRVSIARCLLRKTPVLMLDEATAALDNQTAFEVTDAILKLEGLTRIVVTHRLEQNLLRQYDEILVLREGRIAEQGTFANLMERKGYFYSLYTVQ